MINLWRALRRGSGSLKSLFTARRRNHWGAGGRWLAFLLAATSIVSLLSDFYCLWPMRTFTFVIFLPAVALLLLLAVADHSKGDGAFGRAVLIGFAGGLLAAVAYDVFRLPFVFAKAWGIDSVVPAMNLFKVFPRFGAMILDQPVEQTSY